QFYAVCALILFVVPRRFFAAVVLITVATLATVAWSATSEASAIRGFFFDGRWLMFAEGVAVYYTLNYVQSRTPVIAFFALLLFGLIGVQSSPGVSAKPDIANLVAELISSTLFAIVILALRPRDSGMMQSRLARPLALCGQMCYSLYLVHWPVTQLVATAF